jgi:Lrp/AsnC family transcriptional regulator for asnA, asnC and gidA
MPWQPDQTDQRIIERLRRENATNTEVARELGLSESTVRQRLRRLTESGVLKVTARIDPDALAGRQLVLIAANVDKVANLDEKAREVAALDKVLSVSLVSGRYDLMIEVLVDSNSGLVDFLTHELSQVANLTTTESFLMLKNYGKFV